MFGHRLAWLTAFFFLGVLAVVTRLLVVQFVDADEIQKRALGTHRIPQRLPAARGAIRDAAGEVLSRDRASFDVQIVPSTFRERSLWHALVDAWVLVGDGVRATDSLGDETLRRGLAGLRTDARLAPELVVNRLLNVPARRLRTVSLASTGKLLCTAHGGDLLREPREMERRLRQCIGVLQGQGLTFRRQDLEALRQSEGTLGEALGLDAAELTQRVLLEVQELEALGRSVDLPSPEDLFGALDALVQDEIAWVQAKRQDEVLALHCLDRFGAPDLNPESIGVASYVQVAREMDLPIPDTPAGRRFAARAVSGCEALMSGGLPEPGLGAAPSLDMAPSPTIPSAEDQPAPAEDEGLSALHRADVLGLSEMEPRRVAAEWSERMGPVVDPEAVLNERRERDLLSRFRGGRSFNLGSGASAETAVRVVGPGRLQEIGLYLVPSFVRDPELEQSLSPSLRQILGQVSTGTRRGIYGVEASVDTRLRGVDGSAPVDRDGGMVLDRRAVHGQDVQVSFRRDILRQLEDIVPPDVPFGLAVIDVRTGGVVGLATGPAATDLEGARRNRQAIEDERLLLRRILRESRGTTLQRLAWLEDRPDDPSLRLERSLYQRTARDGTDWVAARIDELNGDELLDPGWHRGFEIPGLCQPGSVFKAITILLGLESEAIQQDARFDCVGTKGRPYLRCKDHGRGIDLQLALEVSCNEYCYLVADEMAAFGGTDALVDGYRALGFFEPVPGLAVQTSAERYLRQDKARALAIGQGSLHCTPIRAAALAASLAVGKRVVPWVVAGDASPFGPPLGDPENLRSVREGMRAVCEGPRGTARRNRSDLMRLRVAAKTGTADHPNPAGVTINDAWFVGFAPYDDPRLAVAVVLPQAMAGLDGAHGIEGADAVTFAVRALEICAPAVGGPWW